MSETSEARLALETRATALGIDFRDNWKDRTLKHKIAEAEAEAASRDRQGSDATSSDRKGSDDTKNAPPSNASDDDAAHTELLSFTVTCAVAGGRRRGGRRWDGGASVVPFEEMTEELLAALDADPMFTVTQAT